MRKNLVVARVGNSSLHREWLKGRRNWDLALSCFGADISSETTECMYLEHVKGAKWPPIYEFLKANEALIRQYEYIAIPDDDLLFDASALSQFFDLCCAYQLSLAQPSLSFDSFYSHPITLKRKFLKLRYSNFVEAMIPCFQVDVLYDLLSTFPESKSGWGLDTIWSAHLLEQGKKVAIVDAVSVKHTRPVGGELYRNTGMGNSSFDELDAIIKAGKGSLAPKVISAITWGDMQVPLALVKSLGLLTRLVRRRNGAAKWASHAQLETAQSG